MTELFISAFTTLFVVIDPFACAPIFASLTREGSKAERRSMALRSVAIAAAILLFFGLLGEAFLKKMGISLPAFQIAGGIMLFSIALEMVFERRTARRESRVQEFHATPEMEDISVFPMAIPMIAGPGSIASIMLLLGRAPTSTDKLLVFAALGGVLLLTLVSLLAAGPLLRLVGEKIEKVITRLLGVILGALAAQFVIDGIKVAIRA